MGDGTVRATVKRTWRSSFYFVAGAVLLAWTGAAAAGTQACGRYRAIVQRAFYR